MSERDERQRDKFTGAESERRWGAAAAALLAAVVPLALIAKAFGWG